MNQDKPNLTFDESVAQVMRTLPPPVRAYLTGGKCAVVVQDLMKKYGLHTDQAGVLERELMLLLMGIDTPEEFNRSLAEEARLSPQMVGDIMGDLNAQIFIPLREEIQKGGRGAPPPIKPAAPRQAPPPAGRTGPWPARPHPAMPPPRVYAPPPQSPRYENTEQLPAGMRLATPSKEMGGIKRDAPPSVSVLSRLPQNQPPPPPTPPPPSVPAETPLQAALRAVTPPQNLPGAMPPPPPPQPPAPAQPAIPIRKPTDTDPYREPIE